MKRKYEESQSELFDQILDLPDSTLSSYLRPKDLLQLSMTCTTMDLFIKTDRLFVRNCYWKYYGPCLTSLRIINHDYLGLQSVEDYAYFMVEDVADYGCLREFLHHVKSGSISDDTAKDCRKKINPNWVVAISKFFESSESDGEYRELYYGDIFFPSDFYYYAQRYIDDDMEVLNMNSTEYVQTFLRDYFYNYVALEAGEVRQLYCSKFGIFEELILTKGIDSIFYEQKEHEIGKETLDLFRNENEHQLALEYRYDPFNYIRYYGADRCSTFLARLVEYMEGSPDLNIKFQCATFLIDNGKFSKEECVRMLAQQVATAMLVDGVVDEFGLLGARQLEDSWICKLHLYREQKVNGLSELGIKVFDLIPSQMFSEIILPAFHYRVSEGKLISLLAAALCHYDMLSQDTNELYCILVDTLVREEFETAKSIIELLNQIRVKVDLQFTAINSALWKDNKIRLYNSLKVLTVEYFSNDADHSNIYHLITVSILFQNLLNDDNPQFYCELLRSISSYFGTVGGLFDVNRRYQCLSYEERSYMDVRLEHRKKRATAVEYADMLISDLFDAYPDPLVVIELFFWELLSEERCGCSSSFIAALMDFAREIDYQQSEDMAVIAGQHFGQNSVRELVLLLRELCDLNFMSDALSEIVWEYCTKEQIFENIVTYQGKRVQREIADRIVLVFGKKQND
ncbi:hypothetical protein MP228_005581 [Amoeboaphelidium protococcarum]|nr:hypothetical protein MP228_005581 [Amoeboaphelidium protococcarum]